jgi:hypothetical protein
VTAIRSAVTKPIIEAGKDVELVCHSDSGLPALEAPPGWGEIKRRKRGGNLKRGVARLVFVMAIVLPEGRGTAPVGDESAMPPHVEYHKQARLSVAASPPSCSHRISFAGTILGRKNRATTLSPVLACTDLS